MGEMKFLHKHTGTVDEMLEAAIEEQLSKVSECIESTKELKKTLSKINFTLTDAGNVIGNLYLKDILNTNQLEIVKNELKEPTYNYGQEDTLWVLFNHITHALKSSRPSNYFENHLKVVNYFK